MFKFTIVTFIIIDLLIGIACYENYDKSKEGILESERAFISLHNTVQKWINYKEHKFLIPSHIGNKK